MFDKKWLSHKTLVEAKGASFAAKEYEKCRIRHLLQPYPDIT